MVRRHEIQVLRRAGHSLVETAKLVGVSQSSVQRVEAEAAVASFDSDAARERRGIGRPSKIDPFRSFLVAELAKQPGGRTSPSRSAIGRSRTASTRSSSAPPS